MPVDTVKRWRMACMAMDRQWVGSPLRAVSMAQGFARFALLWEQAGEPPLKGRGHPLDVRQAVEHFRTLYHEGVLKRVPGSGSPVCMPDGIPPPELHPLVFPGLRTEAEGVARILARTLSPGHGQGADPASCLVVVAGPSLMPWVIQALEARGVPFVHTGQTLGQTPAGVWLRRLLHLMEACSLPALLAVMKHPLSRWGWSPGARAVMLAGWERDVLRTEDPGIQEALRSTDPDPFFVAAAGDEDEPARPLVKALHRLKTTWDTPRSVSGMLRVLAAWGDQAVRPSRGEEGGKAWGQIRKALEHLASAAGRSGDYGIQGEGIIRQVQAALYSVLAEPAAPLHGSAVPAAVRVVAAEDLKQDKDKAGWPEPTWVICAGCGAGAGGEESLGASTEQALRTACGWPPRGSGIPEGGPAVLWVKARTIVLTRTQDSRGCTTPPPVWWPAGAEPVPEESLPLFAAEEPSFSCAPPRPCPPVEARPRRLGVTAVEDWFRDPYAFYARWILGIREPAPLYGSPFPRVRGVVLHRLMEGLARSWPSSDPEKAVGAVAGMLEAIVDPLDRFWLQSRLHTAACSWASAVNRQEPPPVALWPEQRGELCLGEGGDGSPGLVITARADRLDVLPDGSLRIVDYKTGALPSLRSVLEGDAVQIPLEILMAARGGFELQMSGVAPGPRVDGAEILGVRGPGDSVEGYTLEGDQVHRLLARGEAVAEQMMKAWNDPETVFAPPVTPPPFDLFAPLKRQEEWAAPENRNDPLRFV